MATVVGALVGSLPTRPSKKKASRAPLQLTLAETARVRINDTLTVGEATSEQFKTWLSACIQRQLRPSYGSDAAHLLEECQVLELDVCARWYLLNEYYRLHASGEAS